MEGTRTQRPLQRVLFASDRSAASRAAGVAVADLAAGAGVEVLILHVDDAGRLAEARRLVDDACWGLIALAVRARGEVRQAAGGGVAAEIASAASEHHADLVVLGARGRSDLGGLLLGGVGRGVIERVHCPVLLVRAGRRANGRRRRILVAISGDEDLAALTRTIAVLAAREAQVLVLHLSAEDGVGSGAAVSTELVEGMVARLRRSGVRARGRVHACLHQTAGAAQGYGADLVVMGSRRLPALAALLSGVVPHREEPVPVGAGGSLEEESP